MISRSPPPCTAGYGLLQELQIFIVNERAYKVAALAVRALKITSMLAAYQAEVYVRPMRLGLTLMCGKRSLWSQTFVFAYNAAQSKPHFRTVLGSIRHRCESGKQEDEVSISIFPENWADTTSDPMIDVSSGSHPASHSVEDPKTRAGKPQLRQQFHRDNPRSR